MMKFTSRGISLLVSAALLIGAGSLPAAASEGASPGPAPIGANVLTIDQGVVVAYTLIVPRSASRSQLQARAVIPSGIRCPKLRVATESGNHLVRSMQKRTPGATTGAAFADIRACEADLPADAVRARVGATRVPPALPSRVDDLALIGDTGCRIASFGVQDCANDWPLAQNARAIARTDPDAIVFTGDFFYREAPCPPADQARCGGSPPPVTGMPFTDSQYGWMADALIPMTPLFASAPILAARGNHEACNRGGNGYFLFFDASSLGPDACAPVGGVAPTNIAPSWKVDLPTRNGSLRLVVVDSAYGQDYPTPSSWVSTQAPAYERAAELAERGGGSPDVWLITHRPIFGLVTDQFSSGPAWTPWTSMDQQASAEGLLDPYRVILSSHLHIAQAVRVPGYPAQFVIGNGGTELDPATGYAIPAYGPLVNGLGQPVSPDFAPYPNGTYQWTDVRFGHILARAGTAVGHWRFSQRDPAGEEFARCTVQGRAVDCA